MATEHQAAVVRAVLDRYGRSYAAEAGIRLTDRPAPIYQLLVLAMLLSARISADIAVAAARELFRAGYRTPKAMEEASWQDRVDALGRGHYRRYDERTATMLGDGARLARQKWRGDLRNLRAAAGGNARRAAGLLTEFPGIGPAGADIFLREVQGTWPELAPHFDQRVLQGAAVAGLPRQPAALAALVPEKELARLAAALVRVSRSRDAARELAEAAGAAS